MIKTQVCVLGAGPSGVTASIYLKRGNIDFVLIDRGPLGGKAGLTAEIDNYPPFKSISGPDFAFKLFEMLEHNNIEVKYEDIISVEKDGSDFKVVTSLEEYSCKAVYFSLGTTDLRLNLPREDEFYHRGISSCAVCDGNLFRGQTMAIVGGGNSALEEALYLSSITNKVYLIHRRNELRADKIVQERAFKNDKIEFVWDTIVREIKGEELVNSLIVENVKSGEVSKLEVNGIFPYIGILPNVDNFAGQLTQDQRGFIVTDETMKTSLDGVYAVGDVRVTPLRQVITAAADGAVGAVYAVKYVEALKEVTV